MYIYKIVGELIMSKKLEILINQFDKHIYVKTTINKVMSELNNV